VPAGGATLPPISARTSRELCAVAELEEAAVALLGGGDPPPLAFIAQLIEQGLFTDAVRVVAFALPRREAVWWAWVCARKASGAEPPTKLKSSLDATEKWIVQPTDAYRRAAMAAAEAVGFGTPAGCAGLAAFMSAGSIAPSNVPAVPPPELMTGTAVAASVTLSGVVKEPEKAPEKYAEYIRIGLEVADRTKLWAT
jgi:hypothetical protein